MSCSVSNVLSSRSAETRGGLTAIIKMYIASFV